jgi:hypothetical protein
VLLPGAFLGGFRRLRKKSGKAFGMIATFFFVLAAGSIPAWAGEEDRLPRSLQQESSHDDLLDFGKFALGAHVGFISYSSDFKSGEKLAAGIDARVPTPLLSGIISSDPECIAAFLDLTFSAVDRDVATPDGSGLITFVTLGMDAAFIRTGGFDARAQVGAQYGYFGGVDGLDDGVALLVGLRGALQLGDSLWIVLNPQVTFGKSDAHLFFVNLGVDFRF